MTFAVRLRRAAELDIQEAQGWYEEQQAGREVRRAVLHRFPFLVWYEIAGSVVRVLACTHGRANPRKVKGKLR